MKEELKCESHISRKHRNKEVEPIGTIKCQKFVTEQGYDDKADRVVKVTKLKTFHPKENFEHYKCSDFSLDNILAAGATDMLRECPTFGQCNVDNAVDSMNTALENVNNTNETNN